MSDHKPIRVFLSHTSVDKPFVKRFSEAFKTYQDVRVWLDEDNVGVGDDLLAKVNSAVAASDAVIFFWSKNAAERYETKVIGNHSWIASELRVAYQAGVSKERKFVIVRMDETPLHTDLQTLGFIRNVHAMKLLSCPPNETDPVIWRACVEIVAGLRGIPALFPTLVLHQQDGKPVEKNGMNYFIHTWVDGFSPKDGRSGDEHLDIYQHFDREGKRGEGGMVAAQKSNDGSLCYWFSIPNHVAGAYWMASISFDLADFCWRAVDLTKYRELRFNAHADKNGIPLAVGFADNDPGADTPSGHQLTSSKVFSLKSWWHSGGFVVDLDELDWSVKGHADNTRPVNRSNILSLGFSNCGQTWESGRRFVKIGYVALL